ncbi:MAG: hypothetical protein NZ701_11880 [Roseiflexus sp.]|nr:hypothetical protein [Roseiflexus sp.]
MACEASALLEWSAAMASFTVWLTSGSVMGGIAVSGSEERCAGANYSV